MFPMPELPIMPFYVDRWIMDTRDLSPDAYMAYHRLLCEMWRSRSDTLQDDPKILRNRAGISPQKWRVVWAEISHFFTIENGQVGSDLLGKVKGEARLKYKKRSDAGTRGAEAKWRKTKDSDHGNANGKRNARANTNQNQTSVNTSARARRAGFSDYEIRLVKEGKQPSPIPSPNKIREAIDLGQITETQAEAVLRGYF